MLTVVSENKHPALRSSHMPLTPSDVRAPKTTVEESRGPCRGFDDQRRVQPEDPLCTDGRRRAWKPTRTCCCRAAQIRREVSGEAWRHTPIGVRGGVQGPRRSCWGFTRFTIILQMVETRELTSGLEPLSRSP